MIGVLPSKGPAKVSERAGWTDQICFYQVRRVNHYVVCYAPGLLESLHCPCWTFVLCRFQFYTYHHNRAHTMRLQLGKKPPVLTLVDMPGYGHAVASDAQKRAWGNMTRDYLQVLHCVLLDPCGHSVE
jgi:GTP-binding protein EngB required for normal cell division